MFGTLLFVAVLDEMDQEVAFQNLYGRRERNQGEPIPDCSNARLKCAAVRHITSLRK
jgi:hypothetical protein